jgi:1,4-dihydroxy-2-naphthoate octaprenyltransferase
VRYPPILGVIRPAFLLLSPVCVLLGIAVAYASGSPVDWTAGAVAMIGAVAAQISVNALNEYEDFRSGLDLRTVRTPFSGGSGTLVANPTLADAARMIGLGAFMLTALCGLILIWLVGWGLLPIGAAGLFLVYFYTSKINRNRWLCLIAPGLGFGPLMVVGTYFAVTGTWSGSGVLASLVPFFLVSNLLLLNQFPDVEADRSVGRDNLPVALGLRRSLLVYGLFAVLAFASLGFGVVAGLLPPPVLIAMITIPVAILVYRGVNRTIRAGGPFTSLLVPSMALNVVLTLLTLAFSSLGLLLGP